MNFLLCLVFGIVFGFITYFIDVKDPKDGVVGDVLLGILGTFLGAFIANLVFGMELNNFTITSLTVAIVSAVSLLGLQKVSGRIR